MQQNRLAWLRTVPLLLLAMFLLLQAVWVTHMHPDETLVYHFTRFDIPYTVDYLANQDVHPPLWFSFFWLWRQLVGESEFAGRFQALLFSMLTLAMTYRIGRGWFGSERSGLLSMVILTSSAYFVAYALEIRPYALVMLLASFSMWLFARWLKGGSWRLAISYGALTGVMFYVHYFSVFLVLAQLFYLLLHKPSRRQLAQELGAGGVAFLVWLPWIPAFFIQVEHLRQLAQDAGNAYGLGVGTPATTQATSLETVDRLLQLVTNGQPLLYALVLGVGFVLLWRKARFRLALFWAFGVPALSLLLNTVAAVYTQRYVVYLVVGLAVVLGAAFAALKKHILVYSTFAVFIAVNLWALPGMLPVRIPHRDLYHSVSDLAQSGDVVLNVPPSTVDQFLEWQQAHYLPASIERTTDVDGALSARRIWFMTDDWFNAAVRGTFERIEPTHPVQQVFGQCDRAWCYLVQLMEAPPLAAPEHFGSDMDFWGVDVDSITHSEVRTRLWWRVERSPSLDYSFSLRLVDSAGLLVAQSDGPVNHYGTEIVQTSQFIPRRIYIDWRTLSLPENTQSGSYTLELAVYQSWDGQRLLLPDGSDVLRLSSFTVS